MFLAQAAAESASIMQQFGIDLPKFAAQCIIFGVAYFVLNKYAYGPIIKILEERRRRIEEGQLNAQRIKKQLTEAELRYQDILQKANIEAEKLIEAARKGGEAITQKQAQEAVRQAEAIIARARTDITVERNRMVDEVRAQMVDLVIDTTAKVTGKTLTPEDQSRLNAETTRQLAA